MTTVSNDLLRRDVRMLGDLLGEVIREAAGPEALELVETIRQNSRKRRAGDAESEEKLSECIAKLSLHEARNVARAFSIFFDLANIAEDRHRIRVLRARVLDSGSKPIGESIAAGIQSLRAAGFTAEQVQEAIDRVFVELVFTAHPSEAKRRDIRSKLRRMRFALEQLDRPDLLPREIARLETKLRAELTVLWQTDFLRPTKPTVLEEVKRGLSITPRLWEVVPLVYGALRKALEANYPDHTFTIPQFLRFGSWMGGDRDGNPFVTAAVTRQTLLWLRESAVQQHLHICESLYDFLSISTREVGVDSTIEKFLADRTTQWPELAESISTVFPLEIYRRWLRMIEWRLRKSLTDDIGGVVSEMGYRDGEALLADITLMSESLSKQHNKLLAQTEIQRWLDTTRVFGLHMTCLDVRQDARRYREIMTEILSALGVVEGYGNLDESERCRVLSESMPWAKSIPREKLNELSCDTLDLFRLLHDAQRSFGPSCLGTHIISLTQCPSDLLNVLWLWRWAQSTSEYRHDDELRIVPLFEKIDDLKNAGQTLQSILEHPRYREHVNRLHNRQVIMVGYSDSTKDGGYLAACWGLYKAQSELHAVADAHGVKVTFFHGRGGSLGRGGGPAARGILSLPHDALDGSLRLTEQGEVLAERYDDVQIAYRHLDQVTWATLTASALPAKEAKPAWLKLIQELSSRSYQAYRELVEQPGFIQFFGEATPIEEIENLPIGSRPARRRGERTLNDLRAIPWVFAWTQNRCMIPAWYGLGTALSEVKYRDRNSWKTICEMYRAWPFIEATIDNAVLALAKADMGVAHHYAELMEADEPRRRIWELIAAERDRTRQALLDIVGGHELLANTPWFMSSIEVRNPYIDPLNLIQVEFMKRRRGLAADCPEAERESLRDLLRLTVQGVAAGMRTTG
jgi:phosphoenolpyruvate carboxylase